MRLRALLALAPLLTLALLAPPAAAQGGGFASVVQAGDPDARANIVATSMKLAFADLDGDNAPDPVEPPETVYIDLDDNGVVTRDDLRLSAFLGYPAGSSVDYLNRDAGLRLVEVPGWFGHRDGAWFVDADGSRSVSAGDVRLTGAQAGTKVAASDAGAGLTVVQEGTTKSIRIGWNDANGNGRRDDPVYLDVNSDRQASAGELRLASTGLSREPTGAAQPSDTRALQDKVATLEGEVEHLTGDLVALRQRVTALEARGSGGASLSPPPPAGGSGEGTKGSDGPGAALTVVALLGALSLAAVRRRW